MKMDYRGEYSRRRTSASPAFPYRHRDVVIDGTELDADAINIVLA